MKISSQKRTRMIIDAGMLIALLLLMSRQITGDALHEWIGIVMTLLIILHNALNRRWYGALLKGRCNVCRAVRTVINIALLLSIALTAVCGMAMSGHAVPFLYGMMGIAAARSLHLAFSHWSFILMGLHLGMHVPVMLAANGAAEKTKRTLMAALSIAGVIGLGMFIRNDLIGYMFFTVQFAFTDFDKSGWLVILENILMLTTWVAAGWAVNAVIGKKSDTGNSDK